MAPQSVRRDVSIAQSLLLSSTSGFPLSRVSLPSLTESIVWPQHILTSPDCFPDTSGKENVEKVRKSCLRTERSSSD